MLSKFSVKKPFTIFVAVIAIIVLGVISYTSMTTDLLPKMDLPYVVVATSYIGASPEKVETVLTKPLEQVLSTTTNIKEVSSVSSENSSVIILQFTDNANMDTAMIELSSKIDLVKGNFEDGVGTPTLMKINPDMLPVMLTAVDVKGLSSEEVTKLVNDKILPELQRIEGVASVETTGLVTEEVNIKINEEKIESINKKLKAEVDKQLRDVENQLNNAKSQINEGRNVLKQQSTLQTAKLLDSVSALNEAKAQISQKEDTLISSQTELNKNKSLLEQALSAIENSLGKSNARIEELTLLGNSATADELRELTILKQTVIELAKQKTEAEGKLQVVKTTLSTLSDGMQEITAAKNEISSKERTLEEAKVTLQNELTKASSKLDSSEGQLNQGIKEFESSKEEAKKNASIDTVITSEMISNILTAENFSMPAGYVDSNGKDMIVKVGEKFGSLDELKSLTLFSFEIEGLDKVTLEDVADVEFVNNSDEIYAKVNGNNGIVLSFHKQSTSSTANVSNAIKEKMNELTKANEDMRFTTLMDQGDYINIIIGSVLENLIFGGVLAVIILLIFLRDIKPTIIIALSIPISLTFAITLMYFTGVTINIISLSGLALGVGMLVDNSIVVIENIYRLRSQGMSAAKASVKGASSVAGAIFASTLTTICVFLPIVFVQGISRQLFTDMGLTIAYSLLASLIVALTLVPAMASGVLKKNKEKEHKIFDKLVSMYEKVLKNSLKHKGIVFIIVTVLFALSIYLITLMGTEFIPSMEGKQVQVTLEMPKEATFEDMKKTSDQAIAKMLEIQDIDTIGAIQESSASGIMGGGSSNNVSMFIMLKDKTKLNNSEIEKEIYRLTEDLNCKITVSTSNMDMSSMMGSGLEVEIKGNDLDKLQLIAKDVAEILKNTDGVIEINDGMKESDLEKRIVINKDKAMEYGLTVAQVYSSIAKDLKTSVNSTTVTFDEKDYPVVVIKKDSEVLTEEKLKDFKLEGTKNKEKVEISLADIASIEEKESLGSISRDNQQRYIKVSGNIDSDHNIGLVSRDFENKLNNYKIPEGFTINITGENETINNSLFDLVKMLALAILLIYLIMVAQFQSLLSPFIIMFTMPLAFTGGIFALFITGTNISIIAMLGFLMLAGVVVNNGIVLIDYINQLRQEGMERREAIIEAGRTRLRPILMTALTTILGLSTMALGMGMGADMIQPLGIVTIGGLLYATVLTLFFVPCIYDVFCKKFKKQEIVEGD